MVKKPLFPFVFPFCNVEGKFLTPPGLIKSRSFCFFYLLIVTLIWQFLGFGHWGGRSCVTLIEQLSCASSIWPKKFISAPHEYFISFFTSPFFHNDLPHLKLVLFGFLIFGQSFEVRTNFKSTLIIFFSSITLTCITMGFFMNFGNFISPNSEFFLGALNRSFMGGSIGMFGLLGALSHFSRYKFLIPSIVVIFEIWNRFGNGMNLYISIGHLTSFTFGFIIWSYMSSRQD